jgi:hypothetical protein
MAQRIADRADHGLVDRRGDSTVAELRRADELL